MLSQKSDNVKANLTTKAPLGDASKELDPEILLSVVQQSGGYGSELLRSNRRRTGKSCLLPFKKLGKLCDLVQMNLRTTGKSEYARR